MRTINSTSFPRAGHCGESGEGLSGVRSPSGDVALLTAGGDPHYALGLSNALGKIGIGIEFIGGDSLDSSRFESNPLAQFINLRGDQGSDASLVSKMIRVLGYYRRLILYAMSARPKIFHILWNNKFEVFDRTVLMLLYRLCGRKLVLTAHNVNVAVRDGHDSMMNRLTLRVQYSLAHHIFVHTAKMREALRSEFGVPFVKSSVIPFGINDVVPDTSLNRQDARDRLGLSSNERVLLFFGNIAPYKGLDDLIQAMAQMRDSGTRCRLLVAGRLKAPQRYLTAIEEAIVSLELERAVVRRIEFIPDTETEIYFKAADALVLPYRHIFQSGVLVLGYNFGLPVIASDVGSLRQEIVEGETGFVCRPEDPQSLADTISRYFASDLYRNLADRRSKIREFAKGRHSWQRVGEITRSVYMHLLDENVKSIHA